jgi:hypothetical protein
MLTIYDIDKINLLQCSLIVPGQEGELSCVCVLGVSVLPLFLLDFGNVPTVQYFFSFYVIVFWDKKK